MKPHTRRVAYAIQETPPEPSSAPWRPTAGAVLLYGLLGLLTLVVALWPRQVWHDGLALHTLLSRSSLFQFVVPGFASAYLVRMLTYLARRGYRVWYAVVTVVFVSVVVFLADIRLRRVVTLGETPLWLVQALPIMSVFSGTVALVVGEVWTQLAWYEPRRAHRPMVLLGVFVVVLLAGTRLIFGW